MVKRTSKQAKSCSNIYQYWNTLKQILFKQLIFDFDFRDFSKVCFCFCFYVGSGKERVVL